MDTTEVKTKKFDRQAIREAVMSSKVEGELLEVFGVEIEVRPPSLKGLIAYQGMESDEYMLAKAVAYNCYVPGTSELVFEEADVEALGEVQYGSDMKKLNAAVQAALVTPDKVVKAVEDDTKSPA